MVTFEDNSGIESGLVNQPVSQVLYLRVVFINNVATETESAFKKKIIIFKEFTEHAPEVVLVGNIAWTKTISMTINTQCFPNWLF